jgi:hypothetical protein
MKVWILVRNYPSKQAKIAKIYTNVGPLKRFVLYGLRHGFNIQRDYHIHELELEDFEPYKPKPLVETSLGPFITQALLTYEANRV